MQNRIAFDIERVMFMYRRFDDRQRNDGIRDHLRIQCSLQDTLGLILLPRTPAAYAIILITQNLFQSLAITNSIAVVLETIGRNNPLASTTFCFVASAYGVPISYMLYIDAFGFARGGIGGSMALDAITGMLASLLLGAMLFWLARRPKMATV